MEVANPRRILLLSTTGVSSALVVKALTTTPKSNSKPSASARTAANPSTDSGLGSTPASNSDSSVQASAAEQPIHHISNSYYRAAIPIWIDEIQSPSDWATQWKGEDGAAEVIQAVGAWIVCFHKPSGDEQQSKLSTLLTSISSVLTHHAAPSQYSYADTDAVLLAIAVPNSTVTSTAPPLSPNSTFPPDTDPDLDLLLDDLCRDSGNWEYIDATARSSSTQSGNRDSQVNEYGETTGLARVLEALQGGDWDATGDDDDGAGDFEGLEDLDDEDEDGEAFMGDIAAGFGELMAARQQSRNGNGNDDDDDDDDDGDVSDTEPGRGALHARLLADEHAGHASSSKDKEGNSSMSLDGLPPAAAALTSDDKNDKDDETWAIRTLPSGPGAIALDSDPRSDDDVEALQAMMLKLQAARELGADLPAAERRKMAARAVREVMRET